MASCTSASQPGRQAARARACTSDGISDVGHTHGHTRGEVEPLRAGNSAFKAGRETFGGERGKERKRKRDGVGLERKAGGGGWVARRVRPEITGQALISQVHFWPVRHELRTNIARAPRLPFLLPPLAHHHPLERPNDRPTTLRRCHHHPPSTLRNYIVSPEGARRLSPCPPPVGEPPSKFSNKFLCPPAVHLQRTTGIALLCGHSALPNFPRYLDCRPVDDKRVGIGSFSRYDDDRPPRAATGRSRTFAHV